MLTRQLALLPILVLFLPQESLATCTVTCGDCPCVCEATDGFNDLHIGNLLMNGYDHRWFSSAVSVQEASAPFAPPSWWSYSPSQAVTYWTNVGMSMNAGSDILVAYITVPTSTDQNALTWEKIINANPEAGITSNTFAFTATPRGAITSAAIFINCAHKVDGDWDDRDAVALGVDAFHVYAHELGHAIGFAHVDNSWKECTVLSHAGTTRIGQSVRWLDKYAAECFYDIGVNQLANADPVKAAAGACGFPTDAIIGRVDLANDEISWVSDTETNMLGYVVEVAADVDGESWERVEVVLAGKMSYKVDIADANWEWIRLSEIRESGRVVGLFQKRRGTWESPPLQSVPERVRVLHSQPTGPSKHTTSESPEVVILAAPAFEDGAEDLSSYWEEQGRDVEIVYFASANEFENRVDVGETIRDFATNEGTRSFHIVGDHEHIAGYYDAEWNDPASVFVVSTDQELADTDYDGRPDVIVTRWPVNTLDDLECAQERMESRDASAVPFSELTCDVTMLVDDRNGGYVANSGTITDAMAYALELGLGDHAMSVDVTRLDSSSYPDKDELNGETLDLLNDTDTDVLLLFGTSSTSVAPAHFLVKSPELVLVPWNNAWLENDVPIVVAASCNACDFTDYLGDDDPQEVCQDFFGRGTMGCGSGSVVWIGSQHNGNQQPMNWAFESLLLDNMFRNPARPLADAYLETMGELYGAFSEEEEVETLNCMIVLGDPFSVFRPAPRHLVAAGVKKSGSIYPPVAMPANFAVGCPKGDRDKVVITVRLDERDVPSSISAADITVSQPFVGEFYPNDQVFQADDDPDFDDPTSEFPEGSYVATVTIPSFGGCGIDSALVSLYGLPLGYARLNLRSFDVNLSTRGIVNLPDFAALGDAYPSSRCDCVYVKDYSSCVDFAAPDTTVNAQDFALFGAHWNHAVTGEAASEYRVESASSGTVLLEFEEVHPLIGQHRLRVSVGLDNVGPFEAGIIALHNQNPHLVFSGWAKAGDYSGEAICADVVRDGNNEMFVGLLDHPGSTGVSEIGVAEFLVVSEGPLTLTEEDFALVSADILPVGGARAVAIAGLETERVFRPASYEDALAQNYPNPFNPSTTVAFSLARDVDTSLRIYDVKGAVVKTLLNGRAEKGNHRIAWDGRNEAGQTVASGIYFCKLVAGSFTDTRKMTVLK